MDVRDDFLTSENMQMKPQISTTCFIQYAAFPPYLFVRRIIVVHGGADFSTRVVICEIAGVKSLSLSALKFEHDLHDTGSEQRGCHITQRAIIIF